MMPEVHLALHHRHRVFQYLALYALAVSVFGVENLSQPLSLRVIVCQEEPERHFGRADPAHRVYPRAQDKTDVAARYVLASQSRYLYQRLEACPAGPREPREAVLREYPVLSYLRDYVSDGPERDEIEEVLEDYVRTFKKEMGQFIGEPRSR